MIIVDSLVQGSDEWLKIRAGVITASNFKSIVTSKGEPVKTTVSTAYKQKLIGEYFVGPQDSYKSHAMEIGNQREEESRNFYEFHTGNIVSEVGFIYKDEKKLIGCSPDGLFGKSGLELKNPQANTHVKYLLDGKLPTTYFQQVQGSMYVTGYEEWDFLSYFPGMPPLLLTIEKDEAFHKQLDIHLSKFIDDMQKHLNTIKEM